MAILQRALRHGRVPAGYLFTGPAGCGRVPAAVALAASLNCEAPPLACGVCQSCRQHLSGSHPDLHVIRPEEGKRSILIEQVRERVLERAYLKPLQGRAAVFIIDDAHLMNANSANSFLKTLEEPPQASHFVLTAPSRDAVFPTIASRCQTLAFRPLGRPSMETILAGLGLEPGRAALLASMARGSLEQALRYHREEVPERLAHEFEPMASLPDAGPSLMLDLAQKWGRNRSDALATLEFMAQWFRDMMVVAEGAGEHLVVHSPSLPAIRKTAHRLGGSAISLSLEAIEDAREELESNTNVELTLDRLLLRIQRQGHEVRD